MLSLSSLILYVNVYSPAGIVLYKLRNRTSVIPFNLILGTLQVFVSLMSTLCIISLGLGVQFAGRNIVYSTVIW
ncbi:MAG: hypothetical protein RTU92_12800 [Candidatus Thorarchaeota archaeon]